MTLIYYLQAIPLNLNDEEIAGMILLIVKCVFQTDNFNQVLLIKLSKQLQTDRFHISRKNNKSCLQT